MKSAPSPFFIMLRYTRPVLLAAAIVFYFLGVGIAKYLGTLINWTNFWLGLGLVLLLQLMSYFLKAYYDVVDSENPLLRRRHEEEGNGQPRLTNLPRQNILLLAATVMTAGAALTVLMFSTGETNSSVVALIGISLVLSFFYAVPPLRLVYNGYGELTEAILLTNLFPALAFLLQTGDFHRLLAMVTFPLLFLFLGVRLALSLENYSANLKNRQKTMLIVTGWQRGMRLHNLLVPGAFLLMVVAWILGLSWSLTWPGLLTLPIGLFEVIQINQIAGGAPPRWKLLNFTAAALISLTVYLITLALWTN